MNRPARASFHTLFRTTLVAAVTLAGFGVSFAQRPATPAPQPPSTAPQTPRGPWANKFFLPDIDKDPMQPAPEVVYHDFGVVPFGTVCTQKFLMTNPYDVPMQVLDVRYECGCLKAFPPAKVLQPNESAEFAVTMDAGKFKGAYAKRMYVKFGPNFESIAKLEFRATSREDVTLAPGQIDFGLVSQGAKVPPRAVALKYEGKQADWKITGVARTPDGMDVEVKEGSRGGAVTASYSITVTLKPNAPAGSLSEPVVLKTNDPTTPLLTVHVTAQVQPSVAVIPDRVTFRDVPVGATRQYKVLVRGSGSTPFTLTPDVGTEKEVRVEGILPAASTLHYLTIKVEPKAAGRFHHEVKLNTSLGGPPQILVIEGEAK